MTSIFTKDINGVVHQLFIHTKDERRFTVLVRHPGGEYRRSGFTSWFDAYEHGVTRMGGTGVAH